VFGETLVFERLREQANSDDERLGLLADRIDGTIATVFRQMAMNRFEHRFHTSRRTDGELSVDRIAEVWVETQREMFAESVEISPGYKSWWSYIPHFINTPGYVYAYAYGQLLALSAYRRYEEEGEAFVPRYLDLLAAGGSRSPQELGQMIGIDLADPGFWDAGLQLVEDQLAEAEALAAGR
jgi:oligoendopeptidase F